MKIKDSKGIFNTFHAKIFTIKDRSIKDLTEAEEIKKRWQEYTKLYKKGLNDLDNHDGVITHLQSEIQSMKSSGPWEALPRTKLVEVMEFQLSYLKL